MVATRNYDPLTDLLTGVKCRATSIAKNIYINTETHLRCRAVEGELSDGKADEAEAHEDGRDDADEEGTVVASPDALVQPLAVVVKYVDTPNHVNW